MGQPNILLIMADQFRGDCLGIAGHPDVKTPYLDTLAAKGTLFENAYSACPSCIAARAGLLTGMSQEHHRRVGYKDGVPWRYEHTLAGELSKAGYYTQCVGKMHVDPVRSYMGFHHVELHDGFLHHGRNGDTAYKASQFIADDYCYWLKDQKGVSADINYSGLDCNGWAARPFPYEEQFHPTNWVTDRSLDFLRRRDPDMPFFLMASYVRPHPPFDAPACYFDMYRSRSLTPPHIGDWEDTKLLKERGRFFDSISGPEDPEMMREAQVGYYACITHLDHQIGRLLMGLSDHNLMENTVILFVSDHGEELGDHHYFRKALPYEGSSHIPCIISGNPELTGLVPHSVCRNVVELRDIMPTLLEIAGAPILDTVDGKSLLPLTREKSPRFRRDDWAAEVGECTENFREYLHGEHEFGDLSNHFIVTETDKFCWFSKDGREQYFDLEKDPYELHDRIDDTSGKERIAYLRNCLIRELADRPEGFSDGEKLVTVQSYPPYMEE